MSKLYCIRYADGHLGEERTWESVLTLIAYLRWRRYGAHGAPAPMIEPAPKYPDLIPVRVEIA